MKRRMIGLMAVVALVTAGTSRADDKQDRNGLQGTWKVVSYEEDGSTDVVILPKTLTFVFKGDTFSFPWPTVKITGRFKIDSAKKPKAIDLSTKDAKGMGRLGIYELDGDALMLCFGVERPKEFKTTVGSKRWTLVLKREKKKDK